MCVDETEFVAVHVGGDRSRCAAVGVLLRVEAVAPASRDTSEKVLASPREAPRALEVTCRVVGRCRVLGVANPAAWRDPARAEYLVADVVDYEDADGADGASAADAGAAASGALRFLAAAAARSTADDDGVDGEAAAAALREAASSAARAARSDSEEDWRAVEIWQSYCATRRCAEMSWQRAERDEAVIDAALRRGGPLEIPVDERRLPRCDRDFLAALDARHADALAQQSLSDAARFQGLLEATDPADRLAALAEDVAREGDRLAARAAVRRAFDLTS